MQNKFLKPVILLLAFLLSGGISYFFFSSRILPGADLLTQTPEQTGKQTSAGNDYEALTFDPNHPATEECPLNGVKYGKDQKDWWTKHRPLGVMIENHLESRPQSGVYFADVVYEAVAEGGITRFLSVFYCQDAGIIGPVRSARTYFLDFISEYGENPLYAHVGGANTPGPANALGQIEDYGWSAYNDLNQFSIGYPTFWRDQTRLGRNVATEHTMYSTTTKLWDFAKKRKLTNVDEDGASWDVDFTRYSFKEDKPVQKPEASGINLGFWDNASYVVDWVYDSKTNSYLRQNGGEDHMDRNTKKQLNAKNVVVLFMKESNANDGYENNAHLLYGTKGTGKALVFQDGREINATWKKAGRTDRTILTDSSGNDISFNRGQIWFEIVPSDSVVKTN